MGFYTNKKILITGGTGTIGQHLVRRILQDNPAVIRIFSRDEHKQFEMQQTLQDHNRTLRYLIGDVRDLPRLSRAMEDIDYVFHLAAMKHVPSCEYNPFEAVQTNVIGTQNVIQAALQNQVAKVLFTSTDKAVSPFNTYGATKLMAERLISAADYQKGPKPTVFASVRFGNVMGSRGSVIPVFAKQIQEGKALTITNPDMLRYMMTPDQAINLLLKANEISQGGEVFVLKMPVIRLRDLAEILIEQLADDAYRDAHAEFEVIGLRPGEKMFEELMTEDEVLAALELEDMYVIEPQYGGGRRVYANSKELHEKPMPNAEETIDKEKLRSWLIKSGVVKSHTSMT